MKALGPKMGHIPCIAGSKKGYQMGALEWESAGHYGGITSKKGALENFRAKNLHVFVANPFTNPPRVPLL